MKKIILFLLVTVFTLGAIVIIASILDLILFKVIALFDVKLKEVNNNIDLLGLIMFCIISLGIPYLLYLITFKIIISKKKISLKIKGIITGLVTCLFYVWGINTFTMGERPNIFDLSIIIPLVVFFICGYSLAYVDEFFMKKFGLMEAE